MKTHLGIAKFDGGDGGQQLQPLIRHILHLRLVLCATSGWPNYHSLTENMTDMLRYRMMVELCAYHILIQFRL